MGKLSYAKTFLPDLLDRIDFKIAMRNGIAAGLALFVGNLLSEALDRPNPIVSSLWTCLTTILVLQAHLGGTYRAAWMRFLGLIIGTIIGGAMTATFGSDSLTLGLSVAITIILCSIFKLQESFRIAVASVAVIMIVWQLNPSISPWLFSFYRFIDSCFGILIAVGIAHSVWPSQAREKLRLAMAENLRNLGRLYRLVTSTRDMSEAQKQTVLSLIKEIDGSLYDLRQVLEDSKAELLTKSARIQDWSGLLNQIDDLFEQVLSLRNAYRPDTQKLFDSSLNAQFEEVLLKITISFHEISQMMESGKWSTTLPDLGLSLTKLKDELARFRGTRTTREFGVDDVEAFFVFFYSLKGLLELLKRIESSIHKLIDEESF